VGGSAGSWCYDEEGRNGTLSLLRQCASAGVEIFTFPQNMNGTWRAFVGNEFASAANVSWLRATVGVAHAAGIEVGTYQLLLNARSATALNQAAPPDAATLPNRGFDCMDPGTRLTCHNHGRAGCAGGPGCCAMCGATDFYSGLEASVLAWWRATGVSATNQDGAESATPCANESHAHHHGLNDSLWTQYQAVRRTFHGYLTAPAAAYAANATAANATAVPPPVGFIVGMPGSVFEAGQAKVPGSYSEELYSLPRWTWIDATRASIIFDSAHGRDLAVPIGRRMFPFPLSAPYHPSEPDPAQPGRWRAVAGYDSAAAHFENPGESSGKNEMSGKRVREEGIVTQRYVYTGPRDTEEIKAEHPSMCNTGAQGDFSLTASGSHKRKAGDWKPLVSIISKCHYCGERLTFNGNDVRCVCLACEEGLKWDEEQQRYA
jgi:hypothetical protein